MLRLLNSEPVVALSELLDRALPPPRHPIVLDRIKNEAGALLLLSNTLFVSELFPFRLGVFFRSGLLSREYRLALRHVQRIG